MRRRDLILASAGAALASASLLVAGCGSSSSSANSSTSTPAATTAPATTAVDTSDTEVTTPATTAPATATKLAVVLGKPNEFSLVPTPTSVNAGPITFQVVNKGKILHEMVIVPAKSAASLKQPDGTGSEADSPGEVPDVAAGASGTVTVTLPAGNYVLLCNLPGHFAGGMYASLTVK